MNKIISKIIGGLIACTMIVLNVVMFLNEELIAPRLGGSANILLLLALALVESKYLKLKTDCKNYNLL